MKERLLLFLNYLDIGQTKFEEKVGLSRGVINKIKNGIHPNSLKKIKEKYPELNTTWLLTGEGEMLTTTNQKGKDAFIDIATKMQEAGHFNKLPDQNEYVQSLKAQIVLLEKINDGLEKRLYGIESNLAEIRSNQEGILTLLTDSIIRAAHYKYEGNKRRLDTELAEINKIVGAVVK